MAAKMKQCRYMSDRIMFFEIFCFLFHVSIVFAATTTEPPANVTNATIPATTTVAPITTTAAVVPNQARTVIGETVLGQCLCDLTGNKCDINCCCDDNCTPDDRKAFVCDPVSVIIDDKLCYQENIFVFSNSPANTTSDGGLFCIYFDNYSKRNFYLDPDFILDIPSFNSYVNRYAKTSIQGPITVVEPTYDLNSFYKAGDPVYIVFPNQARGEFVLPKSLTSSVCSDQNALPYLQAITSQCTRIVNSLTANTCTQTASLSAASYHDGFRVVMTPGLFGYVVNGTFIGISTTAAPVTTVATTTPSNETTTTPPTTTPAPPTTVNPNLIQTLYNNPYTLQINATARPHLCQLSDGSLVTCNFTAPRTPAFNASTSTCNNVVQEVRYFITTIGTFGISAVQAQFVFRDVTQNNFPLTQTYSVAYTTLSDTTPLARSGNPGYVIGKPIRYGTLNETTGLDGAKNQEILESSVEEGLTIVRASVTGMCETSTASRIPLRFGENMRTGCFIRLNLTSINQQICQNIQELIVQTLEGVNARGPNRYVATFGNTNTNKTGDWVRIIESNRPAPTEANGVDGTSCRLKMGLHIQVLYANVGALALPQRKIIGLALQYDAARDIAFVCTGAFCQDGVGLTQKFEVSQTVSYVDASQPATGAQGEAPIFVAKVPNDFFYPFLFYTSNRGVSTQHAQTFSSSSLVLSLLTVVFCKLFLKTL
ncbi:tectonic-3-like isoform X2 [Dreissena polymorpha]|uniref:tectonic-3-like isoform X2 n=1 Tax=Dreissena polymorpha TaxID=45954 RepID=UPI002265647A|nr:tectonic-3-like isoform X2 [Dreissena polymorpha]